MNFVAAILYAVSASSLAAVLLGFANHGLNPSLAGLALSVGLLVASIAFLPGGSRPRADRRPGPFEWLAIWSFALISLRLFLWTVFVEGDDIKVLSPNNLGDMPLHLTYIRYLASGVPFWPENPIFGGAPLTYPIGVDLYQSLFTLLGADTLRGFIWVGLAGAALTGVALWGWGRGFALFGFLANGGLAALAVFSNGQLADFQKDLAWKSIALALFATQRGLLFALPAGLLLLSSWRRRFFQVGSEWRLPLWGEILLYASLPLFHFHTFLFLSIFLAVWFAFQAGARRDILTLVASAFLPASALVYLITGGFSGGRLLGWKIGWMWDDSGYVELCQTQAQAFSHWLNAHHLSAPDVTSSTALWIAGAAFWPLNFGPLILIVACLLRDLFRPQMTSWPRLVALPAVGIFLVCCFVKFAPWEWDNTKLMIWSYLALLPFLWSEVLDRWPPPLRVGSIVLLFFSGFLSTLGGIDASHTGHPVATRSDLDAVADAVRTLPITERFAGAPTYNHPILLNGRKMVLGYIGHVNSHGLPWEEPDRKLEALLNGAPEWRELAHELHARYLFWGEPEKTAFPNSTEPWRLTTKRVALGDWGGIYDLESPPETHDAAPIATPE